MVELSLNILNQYMSRGFVSPTFVKIYRQTFEGSSWATTTKGVKTLTQDANLITWDGLNDLVGWSWHSEWHYKSENAESCLKWNRHYMTRLSCDRLAHDTLQRVSFWHAFVYKGCQNDTLCIPPDTQMTRNDITIYYVFLPTASLVRTWTLSLGI